MNRNRYYIFSLGLLAIALAISVFNNLRSKTKEKELRNLLFKSAYSIDRDNGNIHSDLGLILNDDDLAKSSPYIQITRKNFDSLKIALTTKDSTELARNLISNVKNKLDFNDSLIHFRNKWTNHGVRDYGYFLFEAFEHGPAYRFGDTVELTFTLINTLGFKGDTYDIVDFYPRELGRKNGNRLHFNITTGKLLKSVLKPKE